MDDFQRWPQRRLDHTLQTAVDWMRTLDWATEHDAVDPNRIAFVGFSMGGMRGAPFVGLDHRVRAAAFCISATAAPPHNHTTTPNDPIAQLSTRLTDPGVYAPMMTGRDILVVAGQHDDLITPDATQRFYDLLDDPKDLIWLPCGHWDFMPQGIAPVTPFLERTLHYNNP